MKQNASPAILAAINAIEPILARTEPKDEKLLLLEQLHALNVKSLDAANRAYQAAHAAKLAAMSAHLDTETRIECRRAELGLDPECSDCGEKLVEACGEMVCRECCDHEYDPGEGMMCLNCNREYPY